MKQLETIKKVMLKALLEANIKQVDINTDSMLVLQYYNETIARNAHHLAILFQEIALGKFWDKYRVNLGNSVVVIRLVSG